MCFFSRCGGGGRKLVSKALPWVLLVTFYLLGTATPVSAPSVSAPLVANVSQSGSSALQEPLLTEEVVALQEIARALKRSVELISKNWSWIKVSLFAIGGTVGVAILTMLTGVVTLYLADRGRKEWRHWKSLRPTTLEDVIFAHGNRVAAPLEGMATTIERYANELPHLRAEVADLRAEVENRRDADGALEIQVADLRAAVADLRAEVANQRNVPVPAAAAAALVPADPVPALMANQGNVFDAIRMDESLNSSRTKPYNRANPCFAIMPYVK